MARVTYGPEVTELAGSIGGVTFQKNASGNTAKLRSNPTVNPTALQAIPQYNLARLVAHWPTLSQANKDTWAVIAAANQHTSKWGELKTLSGYQWFLSCNLTRFKGLNSIRDSAYGFVPIPPPAAFTIETSSTYIRLAWSPDYDCTQSLLIYVSLPLRQSSLKLRRSLFFIKYLYNPAAMPNYDITTFVESLYNVTWADFYAAADCSIIIRAMEAWITIGYHSAFTSAIIKI